MRVRHAIGLARGAMLGLALAWLSACTTLTGSSGPTTIGADGQPVEAPAVPEGTDPDDAVIGLKEHPRIIASYGGVYSDRKAEVMLASIVGRLLTAADQPNSTFTVTILDTPDVNAFALPGGYVYVTRGILALASDTSELAAVLAHEIAHVTLRHARARTSKQRTTQIVDRVVTGVLGGDIETDQTAQRSRLSLAAFNQQQELDADKEGIKIAGRAGYDPHAAARFLGVMARFAKYSAGDAEQSDDFLSSHPSTPNRIQQAVETARGAFGAPGLGEADRTGYMAAIDGILFGQSPDKGAIIGRRFVQPALRFTFMVPEGYVLQNSKSAVVGVAGEGEAVRFDSAEVPANTALADYLKSGWIAGLDPKSVTKLSYNGLDMASGVASTDQWKFRVSVVRLDGVVYRFIFAAKADDASFAKGADATLRSFRRSTSEDVGKVRRIVVRTVVAGGGDSAETLARQMGVTGGGELFYVLNNLLPGDPVTAGQTYKLLVAR